MTNRRANTTLLDKMYTIDDVASNLHVSIKTVRTYHKELRSLLADHVKRGNKNALLFDGYAFQLFEQLANLKKQRGLSIAEAAEEIRSELKVMPQITDNEPAPPLPDLTKDQFIAHLLAENEQLNKRLDDLQNLLSQLVPAALPAPKRGLRSLFHRNNPPQ